MSGRWMTWAGWGMLVLLALFLIGASAVPKLAGLAVAREAVVALGWAEVPLLPIGVLEVALGLGLLWPRTQLLAAALAMALFGAAIALQARAGSPMASHTLFGVYLGVWMWAGLWLRDPRIRALFPLTR